MVAHVGALLKEWRARRACSQLDLAYAVGVSPKHLSFVETGRSNPSADLLIALAEHLDIPLRERNALLLAGGFAPRYLERPLDDPDMAPIHASVQRLLDAHDPYPGAALDRQWNVVLANGGAALLASLLPPHLAGPPANVFRASLHPEGLAAHSPNFDTWAVHLLAQLHRLAQITADPGLLELEAEVTGYSTVQGLRKRARAATLRRDPSVLVPYELIIGETTLMLFTALTTFGSPLDITVDELMVELFFPADAASEAALRARAEL